MSALICGSLAYDTIMVFPDQFKNHILPDKVHILNVSFLVPRMRREFGGCAGNIAYNLKLLGGEPIPMATVGQDFGPYREWFTEQGIRLDQVKVIDELFTPQAFITTDLDNKFNGEELRRFIELADYVTVNDYESNLLAERTGWDEATIAGKVKAYIATHGPRGSIIHHDGQTLHIPPAHERRITDPTGCGDAYRAGLIFGLMKGYDLATCGRMASLMGALKVEHPGTQNQRFDYDEFAGQFRQQFGYAL
ncbi:MAG: carbohydrate kinase family protein [Gammaproteobacteria bacterium]|nr:carbohydrate kinase family protein [Gammaproteobacteria bacterium]